jgi:DNA polymerase III subunit epsilon
LQTSTLPQTRTGAAVIVFDVETTGTERQRDQVIELCVQFGLEEDARSRTWRFRPTVPMNPEAQKVHGISMEDLADCPPFASACEEIRAIFDRAEVIVGYNLAFDIDMLQAELQRARRPGLSFEGKKIVDAFRLWQKHEPRSLTYAHQRFVGEAFAAAHSASADVAATGRVLRGMLLQFGLHDRDWEDIARQCELPKRPGWIGGTRHLKWEREVVCIAFGKHTSRPLHELARSPEDSGYLRWILDKDFPPHVHEICRRALELAAADFVAWARAHYPDVAPAEQPAAAGGGQGSSSAGNGSGASSGMSDEARQASA